MVKYIKYADAETEIQTKENRMADKKSENASASGLGKLIPILKKWGPRMFYVGIAGALIASIMSGNAFFPPKSDEKGYSSKETPFSAVSSQCSAILETDFEPSKGKQLLTTLDPGAYVIEASGERIQSFLDETGSNIDSRRIIRADGTMQPDGTVWIVKTDFERRGIRLVYPNPFPDKPYGALIFHANGNPVFAGTKHTMNVSDKTEVFADVNNFSHPNNYWGEGTLHIIVKQCS